MPRLLALLRRAKSVEIVTEFSPSLHVNGKRSEVAKLAQSAKKQIIPPIISLAQLEKLLNIVPGEHPAFIENGQRSDAKFQLRQKDALAHGAAPIDFSSLIVKVENGCPDTNQDIVGEDFFQKPSRLISERVFAVS